MFITLSQVFFLVAFKPNFFLKHLGKFIGLAID